MDKRKEANAKVRSAIEHALMELLKEKKYSAITVTDIVQSAGVARASYYRNYGSIEEIIESAMLTMRTEIFEDIGIKDDKEGQDLIRQDVVESALHHYRIRRKELLCLYKNGFSDSVLLLMADFAASAIGDMPTSSVRHYDIYALTGAMYNVMIRWLESGCQESDREMATYLANLAGSLLNRE